MNTMMAQITPTTMAMIFCWDSVVATTPLMASLMVPAMVLIWVRLPIPKEAKPPKMAKITASQVHFLPKPLRM